MPPEVLRHCGLTVGTGPDADIPEPLVDLAEATRTSKAALHARRAEPDVKAGKKAIVDKHASRRINGLKTTKTKGTTRSGARSASRQSVTDNTSPSPQLGFDF
jgi:deoxyribodipyrimidine photo-lyase